jgi:hypothetical protein
MKRGAWVVVVVGLVVLMALMGLVGAAAGGPSPQPSPEGRGSQTVLPTKTPPACPPCVWEMPEPRGYLPLVANGE